MRPIIMVRPVLQSGNHPAITLNCFQRCQVIAVLCYCQKLEIFYLYFRFWKYDWNLEILAETVKQRKCCEVSFWKTHQNDASRFWMRPCRLRSPSTRRFYQLGRDVNFYNKHSFKDAFFHSNDNKIFFLPKFNLVSIFTWTLRIPGSGALKVSRRA